MEYFWFYLLCVGCISTSVTAQAEAVFPDYFSFGSNEVEIDKQSDEVVNNENAAESDKYEYQFNKDDQEINGAPAEGLDEVFENKYDSVIDDSDKDDKEVIMNDEEILNSDEAKVKEEIENFKNILMGESELEEQVADEKDADGTLDDYQFEDNRSEETEESRKDLPSDSDGSSENLVDFGEVLEEERNDFPDPIMGDQKTIDLNEELQENIEADQNENEDKGIDETVLIEDTPEEQQIAVSDEADAGGHDESNADYEEFDYEEIEPEQTFVDYVEGPLAQNNDQDLVKEEEAADNPVEVYDEKPFDTQSDEDVEVEFGGKDIVDKIQSDVKDTADKINTDVKDTVDKVQADVEETVAEVQADLDKDLDHLFDTWNKLYQDPEVQSKEEIEPIDVAEYEKKYGKPYGEDTVLAQRVDDNDYVNEGDQVADEEVRIDENILKDILVKDVVNINAESDLETNDPETKVDDAVLVSVTKLINAGNDDSKNQDIVENTNENDEGRKMDQDLPIIKDKSIPLVEKITQNKQISEGTNAELGFANDQNQESEKLSPEAAKNKNDEESKTNQQSLIIKDDNNSPIVDINIRTQISEETDVEMPVNDTNQESDKRALENDTPKLEQMKSEENSVETESTTEKKFETLTETTEKAIDEKLTKSIEVSELTSLQYDALMQQFAIAHSTDMDPQSEDFAKHISPVHISLVVDEPTVVTSPNYPDTYPTNNIVDWIFDGEGVGIEFNITDLELNGALGDYLLVKPGSLDESGAEGLIFSYKLTEPRQYRFLDVDRMFVRFLSNPGVEGQKGFSFSVKMVASTPDEEPLPDPEPLHPPHSTLTVYLGVTLVEFQGIREPFRQLVADMATMYINTHGLDPGANSTSEVTRVTAAAPCNVEWPSSRRCVQVTFGVPLTLDTDVMMLSEDQLMDMWSTLLYVDPFAFRMRSLGLEEFVPPNEIAVLTSWVVIGVGALVSAAMLAFALWRYSCFEDYIKMSPFSDSDSMRSEKRDLDLYPTPHQTLPPLYSEYHWVDDDSTRVDMGGFTNRSFAREELYGGESDDDGSLPRDRYTSDV